MNYKPILVVHENQTVYSSRFFKSIKIKKYKSPIVLICSKRILMFYMKNLKLKKKLN